MRYAIIANPASGNLSLPKKRSALARAAQVLNARVYGLETATLEDFIHIAREVVAHCDVLVVAGGDGTFSDVINFIDTSRHPLAFLPLGTANAMRWALRYKGSLARIAKRIRDGDIREYDLISCDGKRKAFSASLGLEGTVIRLRDHYLALGATGSGAYVKAVFESYFKIFQPTRAWITIDGEETEIKALLSLLAVKQPYYGYGMKVVPQARFDDQRLHVLCANSGFFGFALGVVTGFTIGNCIGRYHSGRHLHVRLENPVRLQIDGSQGWKKDAFTFDVLPKSLKIKC
jgi:diacylglycerol kinase family enzyme